ncbi:hypothetical protein DSO57_1011930 [Entomophthora muscae]|uniref:Uncharacterized protein n=1 Tax=Entomophthora muscae TaxID=34485 RepID=A0ACC2T618_9FUNG|nr:hypothetical protein DSO57_1011930 [Entomophthora muscae]
MLAVNFDTFGPTKVLPIKAEGCVWSDLIPSSTRNATDLFPHDVLQGYEQCQSAESTDCLVMGSQGLYVNVAVPISEIFRCSDEPTCRAKADHPAFGSWSIHSHDSFAKSEWRSIFKRLLNLTLPEHLSPPQLTYGTSKRSVFVLWFKSIMWVIHGDYQKRQNNSVVTYPFAIRIPLSTKDDQLIGLLGSMDLCTIDFTRSNGSYGAFATEKNLIVNRFFCPSST